MIARWTVPDPLAEKFFNYSTYNYVAGNPIALIDPDGRDIMETANGVTFNNDNHDDAKNAFLVLSGRAKNVYVDIEGDGKRRKSINAGNKADSYGAWAVFSVGDIGKANTALSAFRDNSLDNLVLETHGNVLNGQSLIRNDDSHIDDPSFLIHTSDINQFNAGVDIEKVSQLKDLTDKVTDGGRFIIAACFVGSGQAGKDFGSALNTLTGNRLNTYLPTDFIHALDFKTSIGPIRAINSDFKVDTNVGWLRISPNGSFSNLHALSLSTEATTPVKITK